MTGPLPPGTGGPSPPPLPWRRQLVLPVIAWVVATLLLHFGWVRHGVERGGWPWGEAVLAGFAIAIVVTALTLLRDRRRRKGLP